MFTRCSCGIYESGIYNRADASIERNEEELDVSPLFPRCAGTDLNPWTWRLLYCTYNCIVLYKGLLEDY